MLSNIKRNSIHIHLSLSPQLITKMWFSRYTLCLTLLTIAFAAENQKSDFNKSFGKNCDNSYTATCLKLDIVGWVDGLSEKQNIDVIPGVSIVRENVSARANTADMVADLGREFPNDPNARLDGFLMQKVKSFLNSHSIKLNLAAEDENVVTGRKKKKSGGMGGILAAAAMLKSTYFALALGALAALAGKALMTGLISLVLSAILGLKSLTGGEEKTTYEVVSKPVYTHSSSHSSGHEDYHHGGHGRSYDLPLPVGLQPGYKPA